MMGSTIRLHWEFKIDTATQTWPYDDIWQVIKERRYTIQKWTRLE